MRLLKFTVIRDGQRQRIPAGEIVPGDIVLMEAGDKVPADARIVEEANLHTDEAPLTGESFPVTKSAKPIDAAASLGDRVNMLYAGTVVTYGRGRAMVVATGMDTEVGRIAGMLEAAEKEPTPLQQELDRTGRRLTVVMLGICAVVFLAGVLSAKALTLNIILSLFLFAVALAVAAIPEALPAIVTVGLSLGVRRMAAANAIVRKLPAIETLGAATVICSDKTGTLTRNEMTVRAVVTGDAVIDVGGSGYIPEGEFSLNGKPLEGSSREAAVRDAARCRARQRLRADPDRGALDRAGRPDRRRARRRSAQAWPHRSRACAVPAHRRNPLHLGAQASHHAARRSREGRHAHAFMKGAPEILLANCRYVAGANGEPVELTEKRRADWVRRNESLAGQALRTLAIASRTVSAASLGIDPNNASDVELPESIEDELVLLGIVGMIDPPREEVKAAVATARRAHIRTVMITGDHPATAQAIARELEILEPGARLVTGAELRNMSEKELDDMVEHVRVFARVDPDHKLKIVESLQRKGHIVAMTGDGINDAPALKTANIGVAMGITGTDVSKEAADMVLTDDNFASIVKAIEEGRGVYDNIQKYLIYLLSTNSGELMTMFAGVMLAGWLGLVSVDIGLFLPLLAAQLLWINLITDGPPALALGVDPKDRDVMKRLPRPRGSGVLLKEDWVRLACVGLLMMVGTIFVLDAYYPGGLVTLFATGTGPERT